MQSIGERLEEARKRKGISLREASEATKIRSDFLSNLEQDKFDFELPEVYKRGFIKNYANYLRLDANSILDAYKTQQLVSASLGAKKAGSSELFGSIDLKMGSENDEAPNLGKISAPKTEETHDYNPADEEMDKTLYIKVALVALGVLAALIVIIGLIATVLGGDDTSETEVARSNNRPPDAVTESVIRPETTDLEPETVSLIASGTVYVMVKQRNDNKELIQKTLSSGETISFTKQGLIDIFFTVGDNLEIVNPAGERVRPQGTGTGKISIP